MHSLQVFPPSLPAGGSAGGGGYVRAFWLRCLDADSVKPPRSRYEWRFLFLLDGTPSGRRFALSATLFFAGPPLSE